MALLVSGAVETGVRGNVDCQDWFVAACTERMAQLFTVVVESDDGRAEHAQFFVEMLDGLWDPSWTQREFAERQALLDQFPERHPDPDEPLLDPLDIAAGFAVNAMSRSLRFRATGDIDDLLMLAHVCLTFADLTDRNVPGLNWFELEDGAQLADTALGAGDAEGRRRSCFELSRQRLDVVRRRT